MERREWWQIQVYVTAGPYPPFWDVLCRGIRGSAASAPLKISDRDKAEAKVREIRAQGRTVRLVRCTEEVVPVEG